MIGNFTYEEILQFAKELEEIRHDNAINKLTYIYIIGIAAIVEFLFRRPLLL